MLSRTWPWKVGGSSRSPAGSATTQFEARQVRRHIAWTQQADEIGSTRKKFLTTWNHYLILFKGCRPCRRPRRQDSAEAEKGLTTWYHWQSSNGHCASIVSTSEDVTCSSRIVGVIWFFRSAASKRSCESENCGTQLLLLVVVVVVVVAVNSCCCCCQFLLLLLLLLLMLSMMIFIIGFTCPPTIHFKWTDFKL